MNLPRVIPVIESQVRKGCGHSGCQQNHEHEPIRWIRAYYTLDGKLLALGPDVLDEINAKITETAS